jgi:membrane-bound metal-dependent hydrolase YbcI (DUF457 family)
MRFISHLLVGIIVLVVFYFLLHPEISTLIPSAIALLLGSVLPDVDHPFSHVRKVFRLIAFVLIFVFLFLFLLTPLIASFMQDKCLSFGCENYLLIVQIIVAAIISFIIVMIIDFFIPFHRGPLHGIAATVGYSIVCGIIAMNYFPSDYFLIAAAGLVGYLSHIIPDALFKE